MSCLGGDDMGANNSANCIKWYKYNIIRGLFIILFLTMIIILIAFVAWFIIQLFFIPNVYPQQQILPSKYKLLLISDLNINDVGYVTSNIMLVDHRGYCWIDCSNYILYDKNDLLVKKVKDGFEIKVLKPEIVKWNYSNIEGLINRRNLQPVLKIE